MPWLIFVRINIINIVLFDSMHILLMSLAEVNDFITHLGYIWGFTWVNISQPLWREEIFRNFIIVIFIIFLIIITTVLLSPLLKEKWIGESVSLIEEIKTPFYLVSILNTHPANQWLHEINTLLPYFWWHFINSFIQIN